MHAKQHNQTMPVFDPQTVKLPQSMLEQSRWVNWKFKQHRGKTTKMPYDVPKKCGASTKNPAAWYTYEQCCNNIETNPILGIGFVFVPPFIGIDIDHCIDDGVINLYAREVLKKFPHTYAEISPSGTGIHLIVQGVYPSDLGHKFMSEKMGTLEIWTTERYFTVTGNRIENAPLVVQHVSEEDLLWLVAKFTPKATQKSINCVGGVGDQGPAGAEDYGDGTPLGKGTPVFDMLCANNLNWESTWNRVRRPEGLKGDRSDSAVDMSLARMARQAGLDRSYMYSLLVGWRTEHNLPIKHHALVLTVETAHKEFVETEQDRILDDPELVEPLGRLAVVHKLIHLPIVRLVQMGRGEAHYRAHLATGVVLDFGNYAGFKNAEKWERYVWEYAGKHLFTEKKRWAKICRLLLTLCEVEETEEMSGTAETQAWLDNYLSDLMHHPATVDTLKHASPFVDENGSHLQLDAFRSYARIHCQSPPITRSAMMGRLRVLAWAEVKLTRADGGRTITRNYWHKAP